MDYKLIRVEKDGPISSVVLNRPDKRNAINIDMLSEIREAFGEIEGDSECRAVFVRGEGKMFSSGIDLAVLGELMGQIGSGGTRAFRFILHEKIQSCLNIVESIERPVIALLHGRCIGLGLELALACDFRIAADDTALALPETRLGLVADVGGTTRAVRTIGATRAKELVMSGRTLPAEEALSWGLICRSVPGDKLLEAGKEFANQFMPASPVAVGLAKKIIDRGMHLDKLSLMQLEGLAQSIVLKSEDLMEAFNAYTAKREPKFKGR